MEDEEEEKEEEAAEQPPSKKKKKKSEETVEEPTSEKKKGRNDAGLSSYLYWATQHLDSYILLTSKQKFPRPVGRYCSYLLPTQTLSIFNLMSTEYRNQGAVSPCIFCDRPRGYVIVPVATHAHLAFIQ